MDFVVYPSPRLLDPHSPPFLNKDRRYAFGEEPAPGSLLVDISGEDDMAILVVVIHVLIGGLDFVRVVRHILNY